jgi:hypothetical protein
MGGALPVAMPRHVRDVIDGLDRNNLFEFALLLRVNLGDGVPESDVHEWLRRRIYFHLYPEDGA